MTPAFAPTDLPTHETLRRVAGACYLAMHTGSGAALAAQPAPSESLLEAAELSATWANLCDRFGLPQPRSLALHGLAFAAANAARWRALNALLDALRARDVHPVLFKGGAIHARWPELRLIRAMGDYDLIVPQAQLDTLVAHLRADGFEIIGSDSAWTHRLNKAITLRKGEGLAAQLLDIHARVTEPPVCASLTRSILASDEQAHGVRVPSMEDCVCMIALHIVRSGMARPLREYIDLLWYVDEMPDAQWLAVVERAKQHQLLPALFLSLRQAVHCLALDELAPERAAALRARIAVLERQLSRLRLRLLDWLAPADYPLHPIQKRNHPVFRRSLILGSGTSSLWRVAVAFVLYGTSRLAETAMPSAARQGSNA